MSDIYGRYSLTELAQKLNVTPAFINRIQRETGIGGSVGIKGRPVFFEEPMLEVFDRIKALRWWGFTFKEIKDIWKLEEDLIKQSNIVNGAHSKFRRSDRDYPLIIHKEGIFKFNLEAHRLRRTKDVIIESYMSLLRGLWRANEEVAIRRERFIKDLRAMDGLFEKRIRSIKKCEMQYRLILKDDFRIFAS